MLLPPFHRAVVAAALVMAGSAAARAQTAANVAVVINEESAASRQIGEYYAVKRGVPESNIIRIRTIDKEAIGAAQYSSTIERPIGAALSTRGLQDRILYLVLTKGVPLRIAGTAGIAGTRASVDSELTLLYRRLTGVSVPTTGRIDNPYFLDHRAAGSVRDAKPFSHRQHDIYLVTRLDAFTVDDALALVDRALLPAAEGRFLLDLRGDKQAAAGDSWLTEAAARLNDLGQGHRVDLIETAGQLAAPEPWFGYYSWGANDRDRRLGVPPVAGAIAATLGGADARTFVQPPTPRGAGAALGWSRDGAAGARTLVADLIHDGVTGAAGHVAEPLLSSAIRPQVLFPAYVSGFNLAEAFYLAIPHLSWQTVVVGDPLYRAASSSGLDAADIEDQQDETVGLPGIFARRRLAVVRAEIPDVHSDVPTLVVRAEAQVAAGRRDAAREAFTALTRLAPQLVNPHVQLAALDEAAGDFEAAIRWYRRVLDLQPRHVVALNNLAYRLAVTGGDLVEAQRLAGRAAALSPHDANVLDTFGWIHHLRGQDRDAARILSDAARRRPGSAEIRFHAAAALFAVGSYGQAESHLTEAIRLDPSYEAREDVRELRAKLKQKQSGQMSAVEATSRPSNRIR